MNACDQLIDYFNQHLTEDERVRFEAHLATCQTCQEELEQLEALVGGVAFLSEPAEPPSGMKARILDNVFAEDETESKQDEPTPITPFTTTKKKQKTPWGALVLAAALLLSLIGNGYLLLNQDEPSGIALTETVPLEGESEGVAYLAEQDGQRHPHGYPEQGFPGPHAMRMPTAQHVQIQRQHDQHKPDEPRPHRHGGKGLDLTHQDLPPSLQDCYATASGTQCMYESSLELSETPNNSFKAN